MNIAQAAKAADLPPKTIRYYEQIGLIAPDRRANGYRDFSEQAVSRLIFISRARSLGFSIEDCRTLLALYDDRARASSEVKAVANRHLDTIDQKVTELLAMKATLSELVQRCQGDDRPDCPILQGLSGDTT
ncbi:Cu(I)-responsive transcriptional regulator [Halovulum sp. GXIMD14793]